MSLAFELLQLKEYISNLIQSSSDHMKKEVMEPWLENKLTKLVQHNIMYHKLNS